MTGGDTAYRLRFAARKAARSAPEIRTRRPSRCTGGAPESMRRRTVRDETLNVSATSSIVKNLVAGLPGVPVPVVCEATFGGGRRDGLEVR
jgi:hypothetical protein